MKKFTQSLAIFMIALSMSSFILDDSCTVYYNYTFKGVTYKSTATAPTCREALNKAKEVVVAAILRIH